MSDFSCSGAHTSEARYLFFVPSNSEASQKNQAASKKGMRYKETSLSERHMNDCKEAAWGPIWVSTVSCATVLTLEELSTQK